MNRDEIQELFILAADVDRRLPDTARPKQPRSIDYGYVHDLADKNGWGDVRLEEDERDKWEALKARVSAAEMTAYEKALSLIATCPREADRRALWAWAKSKVGGKPFACWCRAEGISRTAGCNRKNAAVAFLASGEVRADASDEAHLDCFPEVEVHEPTREGVRAWNDGELPKVDRPDLRDFEWARRMNEKRLACRKKKHRASIEAKAA
ncbi:MAG: hypothetical protein ABGX47_21835 [Martelella sp.]|uniref:hypothetical protein n=1 Tax=Martelella sp. TaxID=1969699 RepID=UPI003241CD4C